MTTRIYDRLVFLECIPRLDGSREKLMGKDLLMFDVAKPEGMPVKSLNVTMWERMDEIMIEIMQETELPSTSAEVKQLRAEARGLAFALSLTMKPLFVSVKEIAREAKLRYQKRKAGEEYETPCTGSRWKENPVFMRELHVLGKKASEISGERMMPEVTRPEQQPAPTPRRKAPIKSIQAERVRASRRGKLPDGTKAQHNPELIKAIQESTASAEALATLFNTSVEEIINIKAGKA